MDQLTAMKVFVSVVEAESFTVAADRLNLSRTMTSKHVMDLETYLGARLLNRTTRSQSLTGAGQVYFERAKRILTELEEADAEAAQQSLMPRGRLRVNAPMSFGTAYVVPTLRDYLERFPEVDIDLVLNDRTVDLIDEGFDLAVRIGILADSSLIARRLAACPMIACAAPDYLDVHGAPGTPDDLADHACLAYAYGQTPDRWSFTGPDGREVTVRVRPRLTSNNGDALAAAAADGLGITVQPAFIVLDALRSGRLVRVLEDFHVGELGIHAVYPHTRLLSARVRTFVDHLVANFSDERLWAA